MILNHKAAIEFLVRSADEITFNRMTLLNLHALLADGLLEDQVTRPGALLANPAPVVFIRIGELRPGRASARS